MDSNVSKVMELRAKAAIKAFNLNRFDACYLPSSAAAVEYIREKLPKGATVACGGAMTLVESGVMELLKNGDYTFIDSSFGSYDDIKKATVCCDAYFMSSNAVIEDGRLYNVDGRGNRVASLICGPKTVYVVAGVNKLVATLADAEKRLRDVAAPANAVRLERKTPCTLTGHCADCRSEDRICCHTVISGFQREPGRIKLILVGESLGY